MPVPATDAPSPLGQAVHALRNPDFEWAHAAAALRYRCQFARGEDQLLSPLHRAAIHGADGSAIMPRGWRWAPTVVKAMHTRIKRKVITHDM